MIDLNIARTLLGLVFTLAVSPGFAATAAPAAKSAAPVIVCPENAPANVKLAATVAEPATATPAPAKPAPYPTLNPPPEISPAMTRGARTEGFGFGLVPQQTWTAAERQAYEAKVDWFHKAKFGLFFDFLAFGTAGDKCFPSVATPWTEETWNQWVNAVDVEKVAEQARELGAGYVIITVGQNQRYACAPNPVMDELWGFKPGQYNSTRDLPMDLSRALEKRGIPMMLYVAIDWQHKLPVPPHFKGTDRYENWLKVLQWYSEHYGTRCKGWWVDGFWQKTELTRAYRARVHKALLSGNPDALVGSGVNEISDFLDGHCFADWNRQRSQVKPFYGRWDPQFKIQWHALLHLGNSWGLSGTPKKTSDLVQYATEVVSGGGVITFDIGAYSGKKGPYLEIQPDQFAQLKAVGDALKNIPASDGSGK